MLFYKGEKSTARHDVAVCGGGGPRGLDAMASVATSLGRASRPDIRDEPGEKAVVVRQRTRQVGAECWTSIQHQHVIYNVAVLSENAGSRRARAYRMQRGGRPER